MLRDTIPGINKIFETDPPRGSVILVAGGAGTLKSAFIFSVLAANLNSDHNQYAIYTTLEENRDSHIRNMESIGIKFPKDRLMIHDLASFKSDMAYEDLSCYINQKDYIDLALRGISTAMQKSIEGVHRSDAPEIAKKPVSFYALDSLNALRDLARIDSAIIRQKIHELFYTLRKNNVTSFIVHESPAGSELPETYLADGVIEFGMQPNTVGFKRYIHVRKMKSSRHAIDPFAIEVAKNGGLAIISPLTTHRK